MPMMGYYGYGGGGDVFGFLWMIFWLVIVIMGIVALVRWLGYGHRRGWHDHGRSAVDILKERYAKGEIDKKEFEDKKKDLES